MKPERVEPETGLPVLDTTAAPIRAIYYTDPLCCWSWALEPGWRRLCYEFGAQLTCRLRMGGLIPDWNTFRDPLNSIQRPAQMGPHWMYVRSVSGMPIDERIWSEDPPASSYPACLAVKAAERQGQGVAERYLRRLRQAVMLERRNLARREVLLELANDLSARSAGALDVSRFCHDLDAAETVQAFREDLKEVRYQQIGRFPTLVLLRPEGTGLLLVGYRPYTVLRAALEHLMPGLAPARRVTDVSEYAAYWGDLTPRELAEAQGG